MWTDEKSHTKALVELLRDCGTADQQGFDMVASDALSERLRYRVTTGEVGAVANYIERLMERQVEQVETVKPLLEEPDQADQRAMAFFLAGQFAGLASGSLDAVKPFDVEFDVEAYVGGYPAREPAFVLRFRESGHRFRVSVTPEGSVERK